MSAFALQAHAWAASDGEAPLERCTKVLDGTDALLDSAPHLAADFVADAPLLQQLACTAEAVLAAEGTAESDAATAVAVVHELAASCGVEAGSSAAPSAGPEAQRRHALHVLLPALRSAAAARDAEAAGSGQDGQPAAGAGTPPERPPLLDARQLALRRARAMGAAKRCANLRCPSLDGASEAEAKLRLKWCAGCGAVRYCGTTCSKDHWCEHKVGACGAPVRECAAWLSQGSF